MQFVPGANDAATVAVAHGAQYYVADAADHPAAAYPAAWDGYAGHYRAHNPWTSNFRIVARNGQLLLVAPTGDEEALTPLAEHVFAIGDPAQSPERLRFEQVVHDVAWRAVRSDCAYDRFFPP